MKITKEELTRSTAEPALELLLQGIKAESTKKKYTRTLKKIACDVFEDILDGDFEQRINQLVNWQKPH